LFTISKQKSYFCGVGMEASESCHFVKTKDEDDRSKRKKNFRESSYEQDLVDTLSHAEKKASIPDANKQQSTDTPTNTPYSPTTVYVTGMPIRYCTECVIEKMMSRYGTIVRCTVHTQQSNKVFAFCEFIESTSATEAIRALNGRILGGHQLLVRPAFKENNTNVPSSSLLASNGNATNLKRQRQQVDSKIEAIKRKLAKEI
jgi:RNA recognition motif-containing protein